MKTGHTSSRYVHSSFLNQAMVSRKEYDRILADFNSRTRPELERRYRDAYDIALRQSYDTFQKVKDVRKSNLADLSRTNLEGIIARGSPHRSLSYLERRFYLTLVSRTEREPIRLTGREVFVFGHLFERQASWNSTFGTKLGRMVVTETLSAESTSAVAYRFKVDKIEEIEIERRDDGTVPFVYANLILERSVYDDLSTRFFHWPAFVRATEVIILITDE